MELNFPALFELIFVECERKGINQAKIAKLVGRTDAAVSRWRRGKVSIPFEGFIQLCGICQLSPSDILRKWERTEEFAAMDGRREAFHKIIDQALKLGYGIEVDSVLQCMKIRNDKERERRKMATSQKKMRRWYKDSKKRKSE